MQGIHTEETFETNIVKALVERGEYIQGNHEDFNAELGLDTSKLLQFLRDTQTEQFSSLMDGRTEEQFIQRVTRELALKGSLDCLRHGIVDSGVHLDLAYFKPESGLNPELQEKYSKNILSVTRQVHYSTRETDKSVDLVLFINGIPVATAELKNPFTGQDVNNAINQFAYTRDNKEQLFVYKQRALVHFAVDPNEVHMTTKLDGEKTKFLPFNKGNGTGAGNPEVSEGYKSGYLWEEVWAKDSWMDIVNKFIHIEKKEIKTPEGKVVKESVIFPRYHQLDVVRKLASDTKVVGVGKNYLIQHSAGSGKSNSIAWLSYRLSNLHDENDQPVFDSVIVVTDRIVLDKQLQDTIYQFDHKQGVVQRIDKSSEQLGQAISKGVKIIITTIQKFSFIQLLDQISGNREKSYAIIVDEAHSSQGGESSKQMKAVLTSGTLDEEAEYDTEDQIRMSMEARGKQANLSFYAFTATPKAKTLEVFGVPGSDGLPKPFHLYSMRQAIEEGFILDVLQNYITYQSYFRLTKAIEEDPELSKKKANKAIARYLSFHPYNLSQKTEVIVEHFREFVAPQIGGQAKAMVVTGSRLHAVQFYQEFKRYIAEKGYKDVGTLVAFSGTVTDDSGVHYKEIELNGFREKELPEKFATEDYKILLVADKYQTGFDQPLLCAMYVDKPLSGVKAVQTLSRLNRTAPGKEKTIILDFVNNFDEIYESFKPYYELTSIEEKSDPNVLYNLKFQLTEMQVFWTSEIDQFAKVFFKKYQKSVDQAELYRLIQPALDRFTNIEPEQQEMFKSNASQFLRAYAFLGQIITFKDIELEKFYAYLRLLRNALPKSPEERFQLNDEVALQYYKLSKKGEVNVEWETDGVGVIAPSLRDSGEETYTVGDEKAPLSEIIKSINERLGENLTEADKLLIEQVEKDMLEDGKLQKQAVNNDIDNFKYGFDNVLLDKFIDRMEQNEEFFQKFIKNGEFNKLIGDYLLKRVYKKLSNSVSIKKLIKEGENQNLEFKSSVRWDVKQGIENKDLEKVIVKTIAGFMNSEGGQLVIGVEDNGNVLGLENDYKVLGNADRDKFERHLTQLIINNVGKEYVQFMRISFEKIEGKDVCLVTVRPGSKPAYTTYGGTEEFYARTGNATNAFTVSEANEYIKTRWV